VSHSQPCGDEGEVPREICSLVACAWDNVIGPRQLRRLADTQKGNVRLELGEAIDDQER
jgi:hypothetical protein